MWNHYTDITEQKECNGYIQIIFKLSVTYTSV